MAQLKGTQTEKNLLTAFAGESQARNRYTYFASKAKKEGYVQIQSIFEETANHEKEHAKRLFKYLHSGEELEITAAFPAGTIGDTIDNLKASAAGEHFENSKLYPGFAKVAEEEGFPKIAVQIRAIAKAEEHHEEIFTKLLKELEAGTIFNKDEKIWWVCIEYGYIHYGKEAPNNCPSCNHAKAYFKRKSEEF